MYLSVRQCELFDATCSRFEVVLRSLIADKIIATVGKEKFQKTLESISLNFTPSSGIVPINAEKYRNKAKSLTKSDIYQRLEHAKLCLDSSKVIDGDTLYVGELSDIITLFYNPTFSFLGQPFNSQEQFLDILEIYHTTRNALAHPGSAKIFIQDTEKTLTFFSAVMDGTPDLYFWYTSKKEIQQQITDLTFNIHELIPTKVNFDAFPNKHGHLLMRESRLKELRKLFLGETAYSRVAGSVELHGYGGVGKTAIAAEFCYEILKQQRDLIDTGYSFILWLSSKTEELISNPMMGTISIRELTPTYTKCSDIVSHLNALLGLPKDTTESQLAKHIYSNEIKGLVVLDNLETIDSKEKQEISKLITSLPDYVQFLITSRNYEGVGNYPIEITGFGEYSEGRTFIDKYCHSRGYDIPLAPSKVDLLIQHSCGNTLILVLCLERIIEGKSSLDNIITELQVHKESEIELITDFMYKNTFQSIIDEVHKEGYGLDVRRLLGAMFIYDERIDFHSLRELLHCNNSKHLEILLNKLVSKFVLTKSEGYYELHEFAQKYVVLRFLPDKVQLSELTEEIREYKTNLKQQLATLYADKANFGNLQLLLDDWKAVTESDTIAIAMAYNLYKQVEKQKMISKKSSLNQLLTDTKQKLYAIEARSFHPYIRFQKARVLKLFLHLPSNLRFDNQTYHEIRKLVTDAYYETYHLVTYGGYNYVANTESYAAFLWLYGLNLFTIREYTDAINMFEQAATKISFIKSLRNPKLPTKINSSLSLSYATVYLQNENEKYLNKVRTSANEALRFASKLSSDEAKMPTILLLFSDVYLNSYRIAEVKRKLAEGRPYSTSLIPIVRSIENRVSQFL